MILLAVKENDRVYLSSSSKLYDFKDNALLRNNMAIQVNKGSKHTLFGIDANYNVINVLSAESNLIKESELKDHQLTSRYLMNYTVPRIKDLFDQYYISEENPSDDEDDLKASFIFAKDDEIYTVEGDLNIANRGEFYALGDEMEFPRAMLKILKDIPDAKYKIFKTYLTMFESGYIVNFPIIISDTKTLKFKAYSIYEAKKYVLNYERKGK